jgi:hypothetical protein
MSESKWYDVLYNHPILSGLLLMALLPLLPLSVVLLGVLFVGGLAYTFLGLASGKMVSGGRDGLSTSGTPDKQTKSEQVQEVVADARGGAQLSLTPLNKSDVGRSDVSKIQTEDGLGEPAIQASDPVAQKAGVVNQQVSESRTAEPAPQQQREASTSNSFAPVPPKAMPARGAALPNPIVPQIEGTRAAAQPILAAQSADPAAIEQQKPARVEATGSAAILARLRYVIERQDWNV